MLELQFELAVTQFELAFELAPEQFELDFDLAAAASNSNSTPPPERKKTRCSPRTRMLTRMLMAQMSKHMDMQSRRTLFCNSLFEQSCTYFPCYQSAVWSVECSVWSVKCRVWSVKCGV